MIVILRYQLVSGSHRMCLVFYLSVSSVVVLVVFEVARCGASTQLRPDLASTVGPSVRRGGTKGLASTVPLASYTVPRAPASFNNTGTQPRCALVVGVATYKKAKTQTQPHPMEP